jgi:hypothetical protein
MPSNSCHRKNYRHIFWEITSIKRLRHPNEEKNIYILSLTRQKYLKKYIYKPKEEENVKVLRGGFGIM